MAAMSKRKHTADGASFVLFSSVAGYEGPAGILAYAGAKAGVQASVKTMAKELARRGCRVNSISPAWVDTEMAQNYLKQNGLPESSQRNGDLGKGRAEDVAGLALFLLSDRARMVNGTDIVIDGGYLLG